MPLMVYQWYKILKLSFDLCIHFSIFPIGIYHIFTVKPGDTNEHLGHFVN